MWSFDLRASAFAGSLGLAPFDSRSLREHLDLVRELVAAQVKARDQSTLFGFGWSFLHPLLLLLLLFTFFSSRIGADVEHYAVFLLVGLVHYTHFSNSISSAGNALNAMKHLTRDTIFPKVLLVLAAVIASSVEYVIAMLLCLVVAVAAGVVPAPSVALLPVVMLMQVWTVLWLSLLLSCAHVFFRDTSHLVQVALRVLFFVTPIFYRPDFLGSGPAQYLVMVNPLAHFIQWSRTLIIEGAAFPIGDLLAIVLVNLLATAGSLVVFRNREPDFSERI